MLEEINEELEWGDSRSAWFREAAQIKLQIDPMLDELFEDYQTEERVEFVEAAVRKELDRRKESAGSV